MSFLFQKLSRVPKHARFEYRPRFYDAEKEEREKQRRKRQFRKGVLLEEENLAGKLKGTPIAYRSRGSASNRLFSFVLSLLTIAVGYIMFKEVGKLGAAESLNELGAQLSYGKLIAGFVCLLILVILLVRSTNRR